MTSEELGAVVKSMQRRSPATVFAWLWLAFAGMFALILVADVHKLNRYDGLAAGLAIGMGAIGWWWLRFFKPVRLEIRERGIVYRGRVLPYADITGIRDVRVRSYRTLHVTTRDRPMHLHGHLVGNDLCDLVRDAVQARAR